MARYGLFNESRTTEQDAMFFAVQVAVSSYPGDPLRSELDRIIGAISSGSDTDQQIALAAQGMQLLSGTIPYIEYCVWDYTLVGGVALKEFSSWVDDLQDVANTSPATGDLTGFMEDDTSYIVATLAVLSSNPAMRNWLEYYPEHMNGERYFERKTIEAILQRFANITPGPLQHCTNAMFTVMPKSTGQFYAGGQLRSQDWEYLRPVY
jgi:hypothetical protein